MANLKEVKNRIRSVTSTQQITKAMKMVAAAKLRRATERIVQMRPYSLRMTSILQNMSAGVSDDQTSPFSIERDEKNILLVVISSDKGLCGGFNNNAFKAAIALIAEKYQTQMDAGNVSILPVGKRSKEFFVKRNFKVEGDYFEIFSDLTFANAAKAAETVMDSFIAQKYDKVELIFNVSKNVATQIIQIEKFLPLASDTTKNDPQALEIDYIYEPSKEFIVKDLIPKALRTQFFKGLLESNAAEHGARMTAMDKATENAGEMLEELKLTYNRTRQAAITKEILEIVGGAEALASSN